MKNLCALTLAVSLLVASMSGSASAEAKAGVNPAVGIYPEVHLQSPAADESVHSTSVYRVDGRRSAVEFSFHDENGDIVADVVLSGARIGDRMMYSLGSFSADSPDRQSKEKAIRSAQFVGKIVSPELFSNARVR
jgi:hypothetical protein